MQKQGKYANMPIRELLSNNQITIKRLAQQMNLNACYVSQILCNPLPTRTEERITKAIQEIVNERKAV